MPKLEKVSLSISKPPAPEIGPWNRMDEVVTCKSSLGMVMGVVRVTNRPEVLRMYGSELAKVMESPEIRIPAAVPAGGTTSIP